MRAAHAYLSWSTPTLVKILTRYIALLSVLIASGGCATKEIHPTSMSQPGDDVLTCDQIAGQIEVNQNSALALYEQSKRTNQANSALAVGSLIFGYWAQGQMDLSNDEQVKMRSLYDRNEKLQFLQRKNKC